MEIRLFSGGSMLGGSVAFDSSRIVCSTKKKNSSRTPYRLLHCGQCRLYKVEELMWYYLV